MKLLLAGILLATSARALAATTVTVSSPIIPVSFTETPAGGSLANTGTLTLQVPTFDSTGLSILQGVSYQLQIWSYTEVTFVNTTNPNPDTFDAFWRIGTLGTPSTLTVPGAGAVNIQSSGQYSATTTVPAGQSLNFISGVETYTTPLMSAPTLSFFEGDGITNVSFVFDPFASSTFLAPDGVLGTVNPTVFVAARLDVIYVSDVPEASTYAAGAILLAGAGLVARRRLAVR